MLAVPSTKVVIVRVGFEFVDHPLVETSARLASSSVKSWTSRLDTVPAVTSEINAEAGCIDCATAALMAALEPFDLKVI